MAGYQKEFTWDTYLVDEDVLVANIPAPYELFTSVCFIYILYTVVIKNLFVIISQM